jgi:hypothetical protein
MVSRAEPIGGLLIMANETKEVLQANRSEAIKAEDNVVLVELSAAQINAISKLGKTSQEVNAIAKSVLGSRIKGMVKAYRDGAETELGKMYDDASRRGAKFPVDKDTFLKAEMAEVNALFNRL